MATPSGSHRYPVSVMVFKQGSVPEEGLVSGGNSEGWSELLSPLRGRFIDTANPFKVSLPIIGATYGVPPSA